MGILQQALISVQSEKGFVQSEMSFDDHVGQAEVRLRFCRRNVKRIVSDGRVVWSARSGCTSQGLLDGSVGLRDEMNTERQRSRFLK
jgi:hypothetical protein